MQNLSIPISIPDVGLVNVVSQNPLGSWTVLKKISIFTDDALVTIPTLGIVDIPAILLRSIAFQHVIPPGGNLDFLVRLPSGDPVEIDGVITGTMHP